MWMVVWLLGLITVTQGLNCTIKSRCCYIHPLYGLTVIPWTTPHQCYHRGYPKFFPELVPEQYGSVNPIFDVDSCIFALRGLIETFCLFPTTTQCRASDNASICLMQGGYALPDCALAPCLIEKQTTVNHTTTDSQHLNTSSKQFMWSLVIIMMTLGACFIIACVLLFVFKYPPRPTLPPIYVLARLSSLSTFSSSSPENDEEIGDLDLLRDSSSNDAVPSNTGNI